MREHRVKVLYVVLLISAVAVIACGNRSISSKTVAGVSTEAPQRATGAGFSGPGRTAVQAWGNSPPKGAPALDGCDGVENTRMCEVREEHFVTQWWHGANHGNMIDADAVASCLAGDGQPCGVVLDPVQACAWNLAALTSPDADNIQADNAREHCDPLDEMQRAAARAIAARLPELHNSLR